MKTTHLADCDFILLNFNNQLVVLKELHEQREDSALNICNLMQAEWRVLASNCLYFPVSSCSTLMAVLLISFLRNSLHHLNKVYD